MNNPNGFFCKTGDCPASETLVCLQERTQEDLLQIQEHLGLCEFCTAEAEFYRMYPPLDENVVAGKMPEALRQLAEALIRGKSDVLQFYKLVSPN